MVQMAGKPGRSGGARPNSGPKKKPQAPLCVDNKDDPLEFLLTVMNDPEAEPNLRVRAAVAAAQYVHVKRGDGGKKEEGQKRAESASSGKFAPAAPPRLVVNNNQ
jgi:phage terminase small subunit